MVKSILSFFQQWVEKVNCKRIIVRSETVESIDCITFKARKDGEEAKRKKEGEKTKAIIEVI